MKNLMVFAMLTCVLPCSCGGADQSSQQYANTIRRHVQNGQYNLAADVAQEWAQQPDPDRRLMAESCALLSNNKIHHAAVTLLRRLEWQMPTQCSWPFDTRYYMKQQGMTREADLTLIHGTALAGTRENEDQPEHFGYRTAVNPHAAYALFDFYGRDQDGLDALCARYDRELTKRPTDIGLITEYAYYLVQYKRVDRAVEILDSIDVTKLDILTLSALGTLWDPHYKSVDARLVEFTLDPLERALQLEMTDAEARRYTSGWQAMVSGALAKRLFRERLLTGLGKRYVCLERYEDARRMYEAYLELPRRGRWGDRTGVQREYAEVLKRLGLPDKQRSALAEKAKASGTGKDWAELAAYLQGQNEIAAAKKAWEKAIAVTPPTPRGHKAERPRESYRRQLVRMLDDNHLYDEEIRVLEQAYDEETWDYGKLGRLESLARVYLKLRQKDKAVSFLSQQLDQRFDMAVVHLIIRTDHGRALEEGFHIGRSETERLPSWPKMLARIQSLEEPQKNEALAEFYSRYDMYAEYVDLVEQFPGERIDWGKMDRLIDHAGRCGRPERVVHWAQKVLERAGEEGFPAKGSREYINTLEDLSSAAAMAGDLYVAVEQAKQLCLLVPERFYFAGRLAKAAVDQGKQDELTRDLRAFAEQHPDRWVVWRVLADVYKTFGDEANSTACLANVERLK